MIKFPNLDNYISNYNDTKSLIKIRIDYNPKNENLKHIVDHYAFSVRSPFPGDILVEALNEIAAKRKLEVTVSLLPDKTKCYDEPINIWQLVWFINNIKITKTISVTIHTLNPNYDDDETVTIDLTNEKEVKKLLAKLVEYSS